ncbi:MAG: hypothetical protein IT539_04700 [Bradyrhizobiaceae bacterium]|nr:hypothetical protein [Bradyrhizobiaceae bacterium]
MVENEDDFLLDPGQLLVLAGVAILIAFVWLQYRLITRMEGPLRWVAAVPSLIMALFVVLNVISPSNIWPIALIFWLVIALGAHFAISLFFRFALRS